MDVGVSWVSFVALALLVWVVTAIARSRRPAVYAPLAALVLVSFAGIAAGIFLRSQAIHSQRVAVQSGNRVVSLPGLHVEETLGPDGNRTKRVTMPFLTVQKSERADGTVQEQVVLGGHSPHADAGDATATSPASEWVDEVNRASGAGKQPPGDVQLKALSELEAAAKEFELKGSRFYQEQFQSGDLSGFASDGLPPTTVGQPWTPSALHPFTARIYPTRLSAGLALAKSLLRERIADAAAAELVVPTPQDADPLVRDGTAPPQIDGGAAPRDPLGELPAPRSAPPRAVNISGNDSAVVSEMIRRLPLEAALLPGWNYPNVVEISSFDASPPPEELSLHVSVVSSGPDAERGGRVDVVLRSSEGQSSASAAYTSAAWSEDFAGWVRLHSGNWILATSEPLCTSEQQAFEQARAAATAEVQKRVEALVAPLGGPKTDPAYLRELIASELIGGGFPIQQFSQQFTRPYGDLWRCAILVNSLPDKLEKLAESHCGYAEARRQQWFSTLISAAGLLLLVTAVYLLLNAATRGYYVWTIRVMAIGVAAAGFCILRSAY